MRFEETYEEWNRGRLTRAEAALVLGMNERNFRRYVCRFEAEGEAGLEDKCSRASLERSAPLTEVIAVQERYRERYVGWNVKHFHSGYQREGGSRNYSWVKKHLQAGGLVKRSGQKGRHRRKRDRKPLAGMMIHQDGS